MQEVAENKFLDMPIPAFPIGSAVSVDGRSEVGDSDSLLGVLALVVSHDFSEGRGFSYTVRSGGVDISGVQEDMMTLVAPSSPLAGSVSED